MTPHRILVTPISISSQLELLTATRHAARTAIEMSAQRDRHAYGKIRAVTYPSS